MVLNKVRMDNINKNKGLSSVLTHAYYGKVVVLLFTAARRIGAAKFCFVNTPAPAAWLPRHTTTIGGGGGTRAPISAVVFLSALTGVGS